MNSTTLLSLLAVTLIAGGGSCLGADAIQLLSVRSAAMAAPASGDGDSGSPILSPDGRFVLFASSADDLVVMPGGARMASALPPPLNVFLRDRSNATTTLISVNLTGTNGGNADSVPAGVSADGRYVLFESSASDLVPDDTNGVADVFIRDVANGITLPVSIATDGGLGDGASHSAVMTPDGRYVAFVSAADNLVANYTNGIADVFLRDVQLGTTILVSAGATPGLALAPYGGSGAPEITPDGRYVAFYSAATNLVAGVTNLGEIYVRDVVAGATVWASAYARTALQLAQGATNSVSFGHSISTNGQFVTYEAIPFNVLSYLPVPPTVWPNTGVILRYNTISGLTDTVDTNAAVPTVATEEARNPAMTPDGSLVAYAANANGGTTTNTCILVWSAPSGASVLASGDLTGEVPTNSVCDWPAITPDGRFVAFRSTALNLVTNALAGDFHIYLRDLPGGLTTLVDVGTNGAGSGVASVTQPHLSDDGCFVTFEAPDGSLVPDDSNKSLDVFIRDTTAAATELISQRDPALASDAPNGLSTLSALSASSEGSLVAFVSEADNLVPNDTNGCADVFVRDLVSQTTLLVSADLSGLAPGNGASTEPAINADGRYVAFTSGASNLVAGDTNGATNVFVRDLLYGTTQIVSVNTNGMSGNAASYSPMISPDGQAVLFHSRANDLTRAPLAVGRDNVFWRNLWTGTTYSLTTNTSNTNLVLAATMTASGRYAVFGSQTITWYVWDSQTATNVYTGTVVGGGIMSRVWASADGKRVVYGIVSSISPSSLFYIDRATNTTKVLGTIGALSNPSFSGDGHYLVYATTSANAPSDTNKTSDVYLYDCQAGTNLLVSQAYTDASAGNRASDSPAISADGRFVAYRSAATNLVPNDLNACGDIFVWDRISDATLLLSVSRSLDTTANNPSLAPVFSGDGRLVVFESWASDLVPDPSNRDRSLFAFDIYAASPIPLFVAAIVPGAGLGQGVWVTWPLIQGKAYQVQFKNSPADAAWQTLAGNVSIVGSQGYLFDPAAGISQRFYRVVAQ